MIDDITTWTPRVGVELACRAFGVSERTWRHHRQGVQGRARWRPSRATGLPRRVHPAKLSPLEEQAVLEVLCTPRFCDIGVLECWATLLDEGVYWCSASTMHRILGEHGLSGQRRQRSRHDRHHRRRLVATAPNMVWVWDISRLPGPRKGVFVYLYTVWDLWSPKTVGWCVDTQETAEIAERLITVTAAREHRPSFSPTFVNRCRSAPMPPPDSARWPSIRQ